MSGSSGGKRASIWRANWFVAVASVLHGATDAIGMMERRVVARVERGAPGVPQVAAVTVRSTVQRDVLRTGPGVAAASLTAAAPACAHAEQTLARAGAFLADAFPSTYPGLLMRPATPAGYDPTHIIEASAVVAAGRISPPEARRVPSGDGESDAQA